MALGPQLQALLNHYGLGSLAAWASDAIVRGLSEEEVALQLPDQPAFKQRFPEIEMRRLQAEQTGVHMSPISADDILTYRSQARAQMRSLGLPPSFYSSDSDFQALIVNDVSPNELSARLDMASSRVRNAPAEVRSMFDEITAGVGDNALFSLFIDPNKALPYLENLVQEAEAGGAARRFGFDLNQQQRLSIADINIDYGEAVSGFGQLDESRGLFEESLFEEGIDLTAEQEGVEAVFGIGGGAGEKLKQRAGARVAQTAGSSGGITEERGATSLGGAGRR